MKHKLLALALAAGAAFAPVAATAADFINLTPKPKQMTAGTGTLVLPSQFAISSTGLTAEMQAEITKFAAAFAHATGLTVTEGADGLFSVSHNADIAPEGYKLTVAADGVAIEASAAAGLYYAFQTVKKIAGTNVAIGVAAPGQYELPCLTVNDEPRYPWRGMELDCARHFFS
ncbi:MAG: beta-N-acetylhexosaminidase, partial [Muribaculaceae bacterium]|nr:beta-N-acetylhexosaminidase [Muribaculaceae bacterium]